ncbi:MAG: PSD1 and planctomycete cytochrome C domain-containing protein [Verrucomicrobiales bacterium]
MLAVAALAMLMPASSGGIDFNRDIRPILSDNCFSCHGFDKSSRKAGLRLDDREGATADLGEGVFAIVAGKPEASALLHRIRSTDPDEVMPPPESHKKALTNTQAELLEQWIAEGARWGAHWSFIKPVKAQIPDGHTHPVDHFIQEKLQAEPLKPAPPAAPHTLTRRLAFDLTGLSPSPADYGVPHTELIERYLDSPHYGERMAMWWLDGARYSDTDGYQADSTRTNWPWRDWVIDSFNGNQPFDQFTIEQFAGDLLPDATPEQKLATCFHRNHMTNGEGGRDPEQSRVDYVLDRVNTMGTVWLGLTLGCTQCHDHKFDPISQADYYSLTAYFNSIAEDGRAGGNAGPYLKYRSPYAEPAVMEATELLRQSETEQKKLKAQIQPAFEGWLARQKGAVRDGFEPWVPLAPVNLQTAEGSVLSAGDDHIVSAAPDPPHQDDYTLTLKTPPLDRITGLQLEVFPHPSHTGARYSHSEDGEFMLTNVKVKVRKAGDTLVRDIALSSAAADVNGEGRYSKNSNVSGTLDDDPRTGWTARKVESGGVHRAVFEFAEPLILTPGEELDVTLMQRSLDPGRLIGRFRLSATNQRGSAVRSLGPMPMAQLHETVARGENVSDSLRARLFDQYLEDDETWQQASERHEQVKRQLSESKKAAGELNVMVLAEREEPRKTHILLRGEWDKHGASVRRGVLPAVLDLPSGEVTTRLELARWMVSPDNPLTARVIVNQVWQLLFGAGLVRTPSDFGLQGESPTHPQLLDWLAVEFMESGWDVKHLVRTIVTSETYLQDSAISPEALELDPENRLLARGARFRLASWMLRDAKLAASGLLNPAIGGPPVYPWQPPGIWQDQFMGRFTYRPTLGKEQNRRTIYAFWRRTSAPTFLFDNSMRRTCEVVARRTNTPLQALTLLNDTTALEAARCLADLAVAAHPDNATTQIRFLCKRILGRTPADDELPVFLREHRRALQFYNQQPDEAVVLTQAGQLAPATEALAAQTASAMLIANLIFNLDEAITHE